MKTVDILMATYNGERFVREQIESIQAQTFTDWRLLISDDCSTDDTLSIVHEMAEEDSRIELVSEGIRHGSAKANFMYLLRQSDAPYAMFCDQDDVWLPEKVEKSLACLSRMEAVSSTNTPLLAFCDMKVVGIDLDILHESFIQMSKFDLTRIKFKQLLAHNVAAGCCMIINRATIERCCRPISPDSIEMHDWWAMLVASEFGRIEYIAEPLSLYRQHGLNVVGATEYSPLARAKNHSAMMGLYLSTVRQADEFRRVYAFDVKSEDAKAIDEYIAASRARFLFQGIAHLIRSGCWKGGARKLGQIVTVGKRTKDNRRGVD